MELGQYLSVFRQRAGLILIVLFLAVDAAAVLTWLSPRTYEARTLVEIRASSSSGSAYQDAEYARQRIPDYLPLVASPDVLEPLAAALETSEDLLRPRVSAANPAGTAHLQVTGTATDGAAAAILADGAAEFLAEAVMARENGPVRISADLIVPAAVPGRPASPNLLLNLAGGVVAGLALGLLAALLTGSKTRVLTGAADVRRVSGLQLLAQIPPSGGRHRGGLEAAAHRELTAGLLQVYARRLPRVLLLSSACSDAETAPEALIDGWAGHLAARGWRIGVLQAQSGHEASVSGDLLGWSDAIAGRADAGSVLGDPRPGTVSVIPIGAALDSLTTADLAAGTTDVMRDFAARLDLLLVPCRPEAGPLNTALLAPAASAGLVLACYRETTDEQLDVAVLELLTAGVDVLGAVLLDVPPRSRSRVLHLAETGFRPAASESREAEPRFEAALWEADGVHAPPASLPQHGPASFAPAERGASGDADPVGIQAVREA